MTLGLPRTNFLTASAAVVAALLASAPPAAAVSAAARSAVAGPSNDGVIKVHSKSKHHSKSAKKHARRSTYKHHRGTRVVEAPFTYVEKGYGRRGVLVDAPFAFVRTERRGRYVRAPFVDLWIPR